MLGLFVAKPWPSFYRKGMKTWEIRTYPTDYHGDIVLIESHSNIIVCKMQLNDCIPLSKERWKMNYTLYYSIFHWLLLVQYASLGSLCKYFSNALFIHPISPNFLHPLYLISAESHIHFMSYFCNIKAGYVKPWWLLTNPTFCSPISEFFLLL